MSGAFGSSQWMYASGAAGDFYSYSIDQSLRFDAASESELSKTFASGGNRRKWTFSTWMKRSKLTPSGNDQYIFGTNTGAANSTFMFLNWRAGDDLIVTGQSTLWLRSDRVFRDVSGFYHIVWSLDTDNATASQRMRLYVNGTELTSFSTDSRSSLTGDQAINAAVEHNIGRHPTATGYGLGAYLAETHFVDGQALDPTSFGEQVNGVWRPVAYSGSYGTTGFYLSFADSAAIGDDLSGNTNDFTATNLAASDVVNDSPTNNHCVLNPLDSYNSGSQLSDGNLKYAGDSANGAHCGTHSFDIANEKFYWEVTTVGTNSWIGIVSEDFSGAQKSGNVYASAGLHVVNPANGYKSQNPYSSSTAFMSTMSANDVLGIGCGEGNIEFFINGVSQGDAYTGLTGRYKPFVMSATSAVSVFNFGQTSFSYTAPTDYLSLNSENMPEPAIGPHTSATTNQQNFNCVLYTGDGSTSQAITNVGHQPDMVWIKRRNNANPHFLNDSVRGATKDLRPDDTDTETTNNQYGILKSFDSDGFTVSVGSTNGARANTSGGTFAAWNWKAGGTAVSNTVGSITSSVSANQTAGFSIVSYTGNATAGATVGHGLSEKLNLLIVKARDAATNWMVYHSGVASDAETDYLLLDTDANATDITTAWNDTAPTNSVFSLGTFANVNALDEPFIAYCFHNVDQFCKIGEYVGNNSTNGPFIHCNFRPRLIWFKRHNSTGGSWRVIDTARDAINVADNRLFLDTDGTEDETRDVLDILSNGFKLRANNSGNNGATTNRFVFAAWADSPFKYSNAR